MFTLQVIVTVPLFLLKNGRLKFTPDLPPRKQAAISNLGAGLIEKVYQMNAFATLLTKHFRHFIFQHFFLVLGKFQTKVLITDIAKVNLRQQTTN